MHVVVSGRLDRRSIVDAVREAIRQADPNLPVAAARSFDEVLAGQSERPRMLLLLMSVFAVFALILAAIGVYSVLSYAVSQRRIELSVRMALGARPVDVLRLVIRHGLALCVAGILAGVAGALALGRSLSTFLNGVSPTDPLAFLAAISIALLVAVAACVLPARRAVATNVSVGLRSD